MVLLAASIFVIFDHQVVNPNQQVLAVSVSVNQKIPVAPMFTIFPFKHVIAMELFNLRVVMEGRETIIWEINPYLNA